MYIDGYIYIYIYIYIYTNVLYFNQECRVGKIIKKY